MKKQSLRVRLLIFEIVIIFCMISINLYTIFTGRTIQNQYNDMISKMLIIDKVEKNITSSSFYLDKYISGKSQSDYNLYIKYYYQAANGIKDLEKGLNLESLYILRDLKNSLDNYNESGRITLDKFASYKKNDYFYEDFVETKKIAEYCNDYAYKLYNSVLKYNTELYDVLVEKNKINNMMTIYFVIFITLSCIMFAFFFSKDITEPLEELVNNSKEVSKGNFYLAKVNPSRIYEIDILGQGFNTMVRDIQNFIKAIQRKADIEKKLKDQEMKNLQVENLLKEARLKALQSQVNPHFLFNTLNSVVQTAMIEGAYETEKLMQSVSELLRYSLSMMEHQAYLKDEINIVKQYSYIQETRFHDRVKFKIHMDEELNNVEIPGMTLQPLVENAFIHGIEPKEEGGDISIDAYKEDKYCIIKIEDTGCGMSESTLKEIMSDEEFKKHTGHTTGIGIKNVIRRLKLLYDNDDIFWVESKLNLGTKIFIKIPLNRGESYVENTYS